MCIRDRCRNNKGVVLKQGIKRTSGTCYKTVNLWKDGKYHKKYIHRMMAEVFIDNPNNYEFVNHKDEDGTNNHLSNLEWCTREYNVNYGTAKERRAKKIRGVPHTKEHKEKISQGLKAVSYTHLDVYKRQVSESKDLGIETMTPEELARIKEDPR